MFGLTSSLVDTTHFLGDLTREAIADLTIIQTEYKTVELMNPLTRVWTRHVEDQKEWGEDNLTGNLEADQDLVEAVRGYDIDLQQVDMFTNALETSHQTDSDRLIPCCLEEWITILIFVIPHLKFGFRLCLGETDGTVEGYDEIDLAFLPISLFYQSRTISLT